MYKIRENDISLSPTIHSLTWHPFIFASISGRLPMLTRLGQITPVCNYAYASFDCLTNFITSQLWYHATQTYHFHSISPTFSASRNLPKMHYAVILSRTTPFGGMWPLDQQTTDSNPVLPCKTSAVWTIIGYWQWWIYVYVYFSRINCSGAGCFLDKTGWCSIE